MFLTHATLKHADREMCSRVLSYLFGQHVSDLRPSGSRDAARSRDVARARAHFPSKTALSKLLPTSRGGPRDRRPDRSGQPAPMISTSPLSRRWSPADQHGWLEYTRRAPRGNMIVTNSAGPATPVATYRLQMLGHLRFAEAQALEEYLNDLGIGALYSVSIFPIAPGEHARLRHRRSRPTGSRAGNRGRFSAVRRRGSQPRHGDAWWIWFPITWESTIRTTAGGRMCSKTALARLLPAFFDIDWSPPKEALHGKVLLAILGDQFGKILEDEQLQLIYEDQRFLIRYYHRRLPTDHRTWVPILEARRRTSCAAA